LVADKRSANLCEGLKLWYW